MKITCPFENASSSDYEMKNKSSFPLFLDLIPLFLIVSCVSFQKKFMHTQVRTSVHEWIYTYLMTSSVFVELMIYLLVVPELFLKDHGTSNNVTFDMALKPSRVYLLVGESS